MSKNLKLSYILYFVFCAIIVAWNTLFNFFGGVAINFVGIVGIMFVLLLIMFSDKQILKRTRDLLIIAGVFVLLEFFVYFIFEFNMGDLSTYENTIGYQSVLSMLAFIFFIYSAFRFVCEMKNIKFKFIEILLGNEKFESKPKKAKEVTNGSLEEKPNQKTEEKTQPVEEEKIEDVDTEIIISEDEE